MSQLQRPAEEFLLWAQQGLEDGTILLLAICENDGRALGGVAASADPDYRAGLGYWLLPEGRGRGLATRALRLLSRWLIDEAGCPRCDLWVEVGNDASRRVVERAGFELEGVLRSYAIVHDRAPTPRSTRCCPRRVVFSGNSDQPGSGRSGSAASLMMTPRT